jgi:hypothetical protein
MLELSLPGPSPGPRTAVDPTRNRRVAELALALLALITKALRWRVRSRLLELHDLRRSTPEPCSGAVGPDTGHLAVFERMKLSDVLRTHPLRRGLSECLYLLLGGPGPGLIAAIDLAGNLPLVDMAEEPSSQGGERRLRERRLRGRRFRVGWRSARIRRTATTPSPSPFASRRRTVERFGTAFAILPIVPGLAQGRRVSAARPGSSSRRNPMLRRTWRI